MKVRALGVATAVVLGALGALGAGAGCSASDEAPLVEYPDAGAPTDDAGRVPPPSDAGAPGDAADAEPSGPAGGKQVLTTPTFLRGATSDGHLVFDDGKALKVLTNGSLVPTTLVPDFYFGDDALLVRGRFVATWLGSVTAPVPLGVWSKTSGQQTVAPLTVGSSLYAKPGADDFAYLRPSTSSLRRDVWAATAGLGAGTKVLAGLDTGVISAECRYSIAWSQSALVVAGCANGVATANVAVYAADGSGPTKTLLTGSAPGLWLNRARTHALVQTATASSMRPLAGASTSVAIDGVIRAAAFSSNDAFVVYRSADGAVKRVSTTAAGAPLVLVPSAIALEAVSDDARFTVVATTGNVDANDADVVVADATTPGTVRTLTQHGAFIGLSASGTSVVWLQDLGTGFEGALYVASLPNGAPQKLSALAERMSLVGDVVYWQELDPATKSNVLKAARVGTPSNVITIDQGLDTLTAQTLVIGKSLFVASKLGLRGYPAVTP